MKILAISNDLGETDWSAHSQLLVAEAKVLHELYLSNFVREFYFTGQGDAVLILECEDTGRADELLQQLPLVRQGLIGFNLSELHPYTGFSRLM